MVRTIGSLVLALAAIATAGPAPRFADADRPSKLARAFPEIDRILAEYAKNRNAPGLIYGVVIDGRLAHVNAIGVADLASKRAITPDTVFRIASMTKSFTALAVLKLRDEGKLSLDDEVSKWILEFRSMPLPTADSAPLRVRHLLTHSAGFPEDNPWGDQQLGIAEPTLTQWLKAGIPFSTPPGTEFEYSNYGFALAGRVVERASKRPYREYVEKEILRPLGMTASTLEPSAVPAELRAIGYRRLPDGTYEEEKPLSHGAFGAMGGMLVSARDMAKYVAFLLDAWPARDGEDRGPVRRSSRREMQQAWRSSAFYADKPLAGGPLRAATVSYGYGLGVQRNCRFSHVVGHGGGLPGFGSYMMWLPEYGVGMFAMANITYAGPATALEQSFEAMRKTGGLVPRVLPPAPSLISARDAIASLWREWTDAKAQAIAADNLFKDRPAAIRRRIMESMKGRLGACSEVTPVEPENWLRGRFRIRCENGDARVVFTLAPTNPPRVQYLEFSEARRPAPALNAAIDVLIGKTAGGAGTFSPEVDRQIMAAKSAYGACRRGDTIAGDGNTSVRLRLDCDNALAELHITADKNGTISRATFTRPPDVACTP